MKPVEKFGDINTEEVESFFKFSIITILLLLVISIFYTFGAISLSWRYNTYIGTSYNLKLLYAILVFIFPTLYYPVYAFFLNPITGVKVRNMSSNIKI